MKYLFNIFLAVLLYCGTASGTNNANLLTEVEKNAESVGSAITGRVVTATLHVAVNGDNRGSVLY